jgi:hypothetical protein
MRAKKGKRGFMAIKVDLEKAFDSLRWDFIEESLLKAKVPNNLVNLIMSCIKTKAGAMEWGKD